MVRTEGASVFCSPGSAADQTGSSFERINGYKSLIRMNALASPFQIKMERRYNISSAHGFVPLAGAGSFCSGALTEGNTPTLQRAVP